MTSQKRRSWTRAPRQSVIARLGLPVVLTLPALSRVRGSRSAASFRRISEGVMRGANRHTACTHGGWSEIPCSSFTRAKPQVAGFCDAW
jgi:hypothetical protein